MPNWLIGIVFGALGGVAVALIFVAVIAWRTRRR